MPLGWNNYYGLLKQLQAPFQVIFLPGNGGTKAGEMCPGAGLHELAGCWCP
jgi:hypothetical protein